MHKSGHKCRGLSVHVKRQGFIGAEPSLQCREFLCDRVPEYLVVACSSN